MVFAWKKVYQENKHKISAKQDVFICYVHLCLIRQGFICMGLGDRLTESAKPSTSLPIGWNNEVICKLRYKRGKMSYLVHIGTETDDFLSVYMFVPLLNKALSTIIKQRNIARTRGPLHRMIPHYKKIAKIINEELVNKILDIPDQEII